MPTINEEVVQEYIAGCRKHNQESQYALFKHFHSYAMGICRRYAHNSDEASDILSESFLKIFSHIDRFDESKPFKSWMGKIITNTAIDYYRASLKFVQQDDVAAYENLGSEASVYGKLAYDELLVMIQSLSPAYQTVFNLYAIDGYSHNEIAEMLGITVNTSKSNLHKARRRLQELLDQRTRTAVDNWEDNKD
ncbi:RNA polymerase sigma factor [Parapedobacter indicus]|uniref:RNA polymerase sigma-70 factor, ECF subfamily n=1 Tax=Parapedobacter indicus TaxID=1477437 RepID=A0A1I3F654_9SPHI|nr:RNA polymerase sigma factor [Parapedobacter indicus]PPL03580.1 RNA polymerase sigma-70 factor (ECF subfamily) [Parapedobacter indicus]SFI06725.1 RNA polymerase sigma-70 factor, ECF subfamily [Parapedobacter indicus]